MDISLLIDGFYSLRVVLAVFGFVLALTTVVVVWRVRGLLSWERSQRLELVELRRRHAMADGIEQAALGEILRTCDDVWRSASLDLARISALPDYWRRIAACYYPDESQPELCLSVGRLLSVAQQLAHRLDALLQRPGFRRLGNLRIGQVRRTFLWYQRLTNQPIIAWILARRRTIRTFLHTMRFVLPDPVTWIAYLSQRLTLMTAIRCVLIDVYLYTGHIAMDAFDSQRQSITAEHTGKVSETILDTYESVLQEESATMPEDLERIRNDLTGLPGRLWQPPGIQEWYKSVEQAARVIAADYFPESGAPLDEACCRVLLDRCRYWLETMAGARRLPMVRPLYAISLKRLHQIKTITESDLLRSTGKVAGTVWSAWRWARWPIKALRWVRRKSPAGLAVEIGSTLALKAMHNYLARYGFDRACQELDVVYRYSKNHPQDSVSDIAET